VIPISKPALKLYVEDDFFQKWIKFNYSALTGTDLQQTNATALGEIFHTLNHLPQSMEVEDTWIWFRSVLTMSTISALLGRGPRNPWRRNRSLVGKFWEFDQNVHHFVTGPASWLTAPGAHRARAEIVAALTEYCREGGPSGDNDNADGVSTLVRTASATMVGQNWSHADQGAMILAVLFAGVTNTVPTAFWFFMYALADAKLTKRLRYEVASLVTEEQRRPHRQKKRDMVVDLRALQDEARCPLLAATFRETQRVIGISALNRWVEADTTLTDPATGRAYLLRRDTPLLVSSAVNHADPACWGARADTFDPDRFLRMPAASETTTRFECDAPVPRGAFIPFGGGKHLCPGRNFATAENWGTLVALLLGFDITTVEGKPPTVPGRRMPMPTNGIGHPVADADLRLSIRRRKGWEDVVWKVADLSNKTD
jgi:cytochrome P450